MISELLESKQMLQSNVSVAHDIDNFRYRKIEKGDYQAILKQISLIVGILQSGYCEDLFSFWISEQVIEMLGYERGSVGKALDIVIRNVKNK